jgi:hypothetical protein
VHGGSEFCADHRPRLAFDSGAKCGHKGCDKPTCYSGSDFCAEHGRNFEAKRSAMIHSQVIANARLQGALRVAVSLLNEKNPDRQSEEWLYAHGHVVGTLTSIEKGEHQVEGEDPVCVLAKLLIEEQSRRTQEYLKRIALEKQLPEGMEGCKIVLKECPKGHGSLTATNWVQHDCSQCKIDELEKQLRELQGRVQEQSGAPRDTAGIQSGIVPAPPRETVCTCPPTSEYDPPCDVHGVMGIGVAPSVRDEVPRISYLWGLKFEGKGARDWWLVECRDGEPYRASHPTHGSVRAHRHTFGRWADVERSMKQPEPLAPAELPELWELRAVWRDGVSYVRECEAYVELQLYDDGRVAIVKPSLYKLQQDEILAVIAYHKARPR